MAEAQRNPERSIAREPSVALLMQEMGRAPRRDPSDDPKAGRPEVNETVPDADCQALLEHFAVDLDPADSVPAPVDDGCHEERLFVLAELCRIGDSQARERASGELQAVRSDREALSGMPSAELQSFVDGVRAQAKASALIRSVATAAEYTLIHGGRA